MAYSGGELERIVAYFRKPLEPRPLRVISDIGQFPNDILMSYFIEKLSLSPKEIAGFLESPTELEEVLNLVVPNGMREINPPALPSGTYYEDSLHSIAAVLQNRTERFCYGYDDKLITADKTRKTFEFPSGEKVEYHALTNETSANISIFESGYGPDAIYVRENFISMMLALNEAHKNNPGFADYRGQMEDFGKYARAMVIAHELSEIEIRKTKKEPKTYAESESRELESEFNGRTYLVKHGVDKKYWELFHLLRAVNCEKRGENISQVIVNHLSQP